MAEFYSGKKILITGGLGFIGSNLALKLVDAGASVTLLDSMIPAYGASLENVKPIANRVQINFSDIRDQYSLGYIVKDKDIIFSLAGQVSHIDSMLAPITDLEINCQSQLSLLESCRSKNHNVKIVFASTRQVYGRPKYLPVDEQHPLDPVDVNGINKLAAESYYRLYNDVYGIKSTSLRLTNTYGPRMDLKSDTKGFIGIFVRKALKGETIQLYGTGDQKRDFNYVDDVSNALLLAGANDAVNGKTFNLGHPKPQSLMELVQALRKLSDFKIECVPFPPERKRIDIGDYYGSFEAFQKATGWSPETSLERGLERTIRYFKEPLQ